jgi:hypothetical protein
VTRISEIFLRCFQSFANLAISLYA